MTADPTATTTRVRLLLGAVFVVYLSQMALNPIIAPLAREVGLPDWQVGVTISAAAMTVVVTSQMWGRKSQSWGRKPVLVAALALATVSTAAFAGVAYLGMIGALVGTTLFVAFIALRGIGFGAAVAAMPPTAQAYITDITDDETTRVKGMAALGAIQASSMITGAALGGILAVFGLLVPLIVIPILLAIGWVLLAARLQREPRTTLIARPARVSPFDRRVFPFLLCGFGMMTALGFVQVITGFIVQDRLGVGAAQTGALTGAAIASTGVGLAVAQSTIVRRVSWAPPTLIRIGTLVAACGFALFAFDLGAAPLFVAMGVIGMGLGIAMPGYVAGPTLFMSREEQGGLAGVIGATNGLTFVVAPTLSTFLYEKSPALPVVIGGVTLALVCLLSLMLPRHRADAPVEPETAAVVEQPTATIPGGHDSSASRAVHDEQRSGPGMPLQRATSSTSTSDAASDVSVSSEGGSSDT